MAATRKDLLKAHSFTTQRLVGALVDREPDKAVPPLRRISVAGIVSLLIGVVMIAGSLLLGVLKPGGSNQWQQGGVIVEDLTSGVLFVYNEETQSLTQLANVTSARLYAAGKEATEMPKVVTVKSSKLRGVKMNPRIGIPNAPWQLPDKADIKPYPLKVCASKPNGFGERFLTVELGAQQSASSETVAIAAQTPKGQQYVIMGGKAHHLYSRDGGTSPLVEGLPIAQVSDAWLAAIPVGQPIEPIDVPGKGGKPANGTLLIGTLARVGADNSPDVRYYIQLNEGLARISYLDMKLAQAGGAGEPTTLTEAQFAPHGIRTSVGTQGLPFEKPVGPKGYGTLDAVSVCATYFDGETGPQISVDTPIPAIPQTKVHPVGNRADVISMPTLSGALLQNDRGLEGQATPTVLIYDQKSYGIPNRVSRLALGYDDKTPIARVPAGLIQLFTPGLEAGLDLSINSIKPMG